VALLTLFYLASSVATSRANAEATRQMERALTDPLAAMEATNHEPLVVSAIEPHQRIDGRRIEQRMAVNP
jgi:hypothetical protein